MSACWSGSEKRTRSGDPSDHRSPSGSCGCPSQYYRTGKKSSPGKEQINHVSSCFSGNGEAVANKNYINSKGGKNMNKKVISALLCGTMILGAASPVFAAGEGQKIALVGKSAGNAFFEIAAASFKETVEAEGATVEVVYPETATADAQIKVLDNLISQDFDAICIAANDVNALQAKLEEAMDAGIKVSSFDSAPNKDSRQVFINQAGTQAVGQALMDAVLDISGGEGQFAILSATSQGANQNAWIDAMKYIMEGDEKYSKLELVEVAYGDDEPQKSTDQTAALIQNYPDLKVICAPTTVGIAAAAKYLQDNESTCKLTGL